MWEPIWASRFRYWLLTGDMSRSCLHSSRTCRVRMLKVRWRLYYELCAFDVPKVVRSPVWDRGHDEESRNGRDVKINILDDYIRTSESFRVIQVFSGVPESYGNSPGSIWALLGFRGMRKERLRAPPRPSPNWTRGRGCAPSFLLFSLLFPWLLLLRGYCWKYALEAIIKWLLLYFFVHDNCLLFML